ncbi:hypothetical protein HYH03_008664 [Edaphochlamys debaryana]|uniref:Fungal lipase-type domain-containing protein n=1 Tax=Edaphochlamys debaryana TaxID=47281 RepID=A0A836BXX7_9CHLO|nr:hypothetical protein HYH03_008664 [Edaphochlamys debaryana]|eukprot:KAG2493000.1 hypothetical protein HYH03_008664 [Edaphochlamys debaryana]
MVDRMQRGARQRQRACMRLALVTLLIAHQASALRLPSWGNLLRPKREKRDPEDILREVLSPKSTVLASLHSSKGPRDAGASPKASAQLQGSIALGDPAARDVCPSDPAIATIFSSQAARTLPRLARGPSVTLGGAGDAAHAAHGASSLAASKGTDFNPDRAGVSGGQGHGSGQPHTEPDSEPLEAADPDPPDLDLDEAMLAGRLASIAYCAHPETLQSWNCTRCAEVPGFVPHTVAFDSVWDLSAFAGYHKPSDTVWLSFRGTDSSNWSQWAENMRAWRTDHMYPVPNFPHALIHAGFYTLWTGSSLQKTFTDAVVELMAAHPRSRMVVTGHSMGGALAQLAGLEFKLSYNRTLTTVYTWGSPRVGNLAYAQLFSTFVDVSWRFTHNRDIVPSVPLQLMGFQHVAREVWEVDVDDPAGGPPRDRKLLLCDGTGEDPSCHNSACYLGLCTSVADHLLYLGIPMYGDEGEC